MNDEQPLLSVPDAAHILGIKPTHLARLIRAGAFPCVRIGRWVRVRPSDVQHARTRGVKPSRVS